MCEYVVCGQVACESCVCVKVVCEEAGGGGGGGGGGRRQGGSAQPKTRTPHKDVGKKHETAQPRFTPINACQRLLIHAWTVCWNVCSATKPFWVLMNRNRCYPSQYPVTKRLLS